MFRNRHLLTYPFLVTILLLTSCQNPHPAANKIWKVEVATSECNGICQNTITVIDSNLNYHFYGGRVAKGGDYGRKGKIFGFYASKISRAYWDSLTTRLEDNNYQSPDTGYQQENDVQFLELLVHYGKQTKRIHAYDIDLPDGIRSTIDWVAGSYAAIRPVATKDTFKTDIKDWGGWE